MTATPIQTNIAQQFLTRGRRAAWRPERGTITYADASLPEGSNRVSVELDRRRPRSTARGSWRGPLPPERAARSTFPMAREDGEWRIADAPRRADRPGDVVRARRSGRSRSTSSTRPPRSWCPSRSSCRGATSSPGLSTGCSRARPGGCDAASSSSFVPPGARRRPLGAGLRRRGRRDPADRRRPAMPSRERRRADDRPAGLDPAPGLLGSRRPGLDRRRAGDPVRAGSTVFAMDRRRDYDPAGFQSPARCSAAARRAAGRRAAGGARPGRAAAGRRGARAPRVGVDLRRRRRSPA